MKTQKTAAEILNIRTADERVFEDCGLWVILPSRKDSRAQEIAAAGTFNGEKVAYNTYGIPSKRNPAKPGESIKEWEPMTLTIHPRDYRERLQAEDDRREHEHAKRVKEFGLDIAIRQLLRIAGKVSK